MLDLTTDYFTRHDLEPASSVQAEYRPRAQTDRRTAQSGVPSSPSHRRRRNDKLCAATTTPSH